MVIPLYGIERWLGRLFSHVKPIITHPCVKPNEICMSLTPQERFKGNHLLPHLGNAQAWWSLPRGDK